MSGLPGPVEGLERPTSVILSATKNLGRGIPSPYGGRLGLSLSLAKDFLPGSLRGVPSDIKRLGGWVGRKTLAIIQSLIRAHAAPPPDRQPLTIPHQIPIMSAHGTRGNAIKAKHLRVRKKVWSLAIFLLAAAIYPVGRFLEIALGDPIDPSFFPALEIFALGYFAVSLGGRAFWRRRRTRTRIQRWGWVLVPLYRAGFVTFLFLMVLVGVFFVSTTGMAD